MKKLILIIWAFGLLLNATDKKQLLPDTNLVPGESYYGTGKYIEYIHGNMPLVLTAPHGGYEKPENIKDRTKSSVKQDKRTLEMTLEISDVIFKLTGKRPYLVINNLHRVKLDPNRNEEIAVQGDSLARIAFNEFHEFIELAEKSVYNIWNTGFYIDIHAHRSKNRKIELGYLLDGEVLSLSDNDIDDPFFVQNSSIRNLAAHSEYSFSNLIRGEVSFGAILSKSGWEVLPSPLQHEPTSEKYFAGGYNTTIHAAPEKYNFNGFQIETHWDGLRDTDENMKRFCTDFVYALRDYLMLHYKIDITTF